MTPRDRLVRLEGCFNFRDLGGYATADGRRVRWGRLYRSDAIHHLTEADLRVLRDDIGLRTLIDLRSTSELAGEPAAALAAPPMRVHHVPLFETTGSGRRPQLPLDQIYLLMLRFARAPIARVVTLIAECGDPTLFHCAAGKDRTGLVSAVLLGALGVRDEEIVEDYAATREGLEGIVARLRASASYDFVFEEFPPETMHAEPETMESVLAEVQREYGGMRAYLTGSGVEPATMERLGDSLLEPA